MAKPKRKPDESQPTSDKPDTHGTPTLNPPDHTTDATDRHAPIETEGHPCHWHDPLHWPSYMPMPRSVQTALARLLETRTLATLQEQLTADIIQQEVDRLNGIGTGYELPQKESPFRSLARKSRRTSGYQGVHRDRNKWRAKINRGGVETYLGTYDDEFTAAIVFQVADQEYNKLGLTSQRGANRKPKACTNHQPAETFLADSPVQGLQ